MKTVQKGYRKDQFVMGLADLADGLVAVFSFGHLVTHFSLRMAVRLTTKRLKDRQGEKI